jgi:hypothetical protein
MERLEARQQSRGAQTARASAGFLNYQAGVGYADSDVRMTRFTAPHMRH